MNERLIRKLKKVLALTESCNEHEAMAATRQLHAMLAKHNMSITDISSDENDIELSEESWETSNFPWKRTVSQKIAELYFCDFYYQQTRKNYANFVLIGTEENRLFALNITKIVIKTLEREARKASKEIHGKIDSRFITSFFTGATLRIVKRCKELITAAKEGTLQDYSPDVGQESSGNTLPSLLGTYELMEKKIEEYILTNLNLNLKTTKSHLNIHDYDGVAAGTAAGDKVQLSRALHHDQSPKLLN